jgi:hypothetical protein
MDLNYKKINFGLQLALWLWFNSIGYLIVGIVGRRLNDLTQIKSCINVW